MRRTSRGLAVIAVVVASFSLSASADVRERCDGPALPYLSCVTAGYRWEIVGTPDDDRLVGYWSDDVIYSKGGRDVVNGRGGYDVCYAGPRDRVWNCEEVR